MKPPIFTLCVGNAWGEAALLLAAGSKGNRSALPSSTIMIRQVRSQPFNNVLSLFYVFGCLFPNTNHVPLFNMQPIARFQGQASDIDIARKELTALKKGLVRTTFI